MSKPVSLARPPTPLAAFHKRAVRRMIGDVPDDLSGEENWDVMNVSRWRARADLIVARHRGRERGKPPFLQGPVWGLVSMPASSRRTSWDKKRSFHFRVHPPTTGRGASDHDRYARERAAKIKAAELGAAQDVNQAAAADGYQSGHGGNEGSAPATISNLSPDTQLRRDNWNAIEQFELTRGTVRKERRERGEDRINVKVAIAFKLVRAVAAEPDCPEALRDLIQKEGDRLSAGAALNPRREKIGAAYVTNDAEGVFGWIKRTTAWATASEEERNAFSLSRGRGPQPVLVGDVELPAELSMAGRLQVMHDLHRFLEDPERSADPADNTGQRRKVPATVALHLPDHLNHASNGHLHFVVGKRYFLIGPDGALARDEAGELIADERMVGFYWKPGFHERLRQEVARMVNKQLEKESVAIRIHPGKDAVLGHEGPTMRHLSTAATVLARAGVPTADRLDNSIIAWSRKFEEVREAEKLARKEARREVELARAQARASEPDLQRAMPHAYRARLAAIRARREADEVELLIYMAISGPAEVARYAPAYANDARAKGRAPFQINGWQARADLAQAELERLHIELAPEREAIALRRKAEREADLAADAILLRADRDIDYGDAHEAAGEHRNPVPVPERRGPDPASSPRQANRLVDLIADTPVKVTRVDGRLTVRPEDDPQGIISGADLSKVQTRLGAIEKAQARELAQIAAYLARHGAPPDDTSRGTSEWLRRSFARWQPTPAYQRLLADQEAKASVTSIAAISKTLSGPTKASQAPAISSGQPGPTWSADEQRLLRARELASQDERFRARRTLQRALIDRAGDEARITPLAARLLQRVAAGFNPEQIDPTPGRFGRTRDQQDAIELSIVARDPLFAGRVDAARRKDSKLLRQVSDGTRRVHIADQYGAVYVSESGTVATGLRSGLAEATRAMPHDLALRALERSRTLPILKRDSDSGLVGIHQPDLIAAFGHNVIGLLHPDVQLELELRYRMQEAEKAILLDRVRAGQSTLSLEVRADRHEIRSRVQIVTGDAADRAVVQRLAADRDFYLECRRTLREPRRWGGVEPQVAAYRAWLSAVKEGASPHIVAALAKIALAEPDLRASARTALAARLSASLNGAPKARPGDLQASSKESEIER